MNTEELMSIKVEQAHSILNYDSTTIKNILSKYEIIASVEKGITNKEVILDNKEVYKVLLLPIMYKTMYNVTNSSVYKEFSTAVPNYDAVVKDLSNRNKLFAKYGKMLFESGVKFNETEELSEDRVKSVLLLFGVQEDIEFDEDIDGEEIDIDELMDSSAEIELPDKVEDNVEEEKDLHSELKKVWGDKLEPVIDGIMDTYKRLYESGYGLVSPCGILTNDGAIRSTTDGRVIPAGNKAVDMDVFRAITEVLRTGYNLYAGAGREPQITDIDRAKEPIIYTDLHLQIMFGHFRFCKGLQGYLKEQGIENESTTKVIKYSTMSGWVYRKLEEYFYSAYESYGVTTQATERDLEIVNKINESMSRSLKNVIVVAERKKGVNTRIRIASDSRIDSDRLIRAMEQRLNIGTASGIEVKQIGAYESGVLDINVIYNNKKYSQDALFAYQVLDILDEQGIRPRWDNVILGKKDDGTIMTYNFKDKRNAVYAMYASSRSGKGTMTLNLIASAMADLCKILYIDGKPDMGCVLADIAWKNGVDAAVYNGVAGKGTELLENRGNCIRTETPFMDSENIPDGIFITTEEKRRYMLITTYIRGIELVCELAADRASKDMSSDDWVVAFVDECEQASVAEIEVMKCLDRAETNRKAQKGPDGKKIDLTRDEAYKFIQEYRAWLSLVESKFKTCVTSTFGFANMTTFFIWQSTKFPEQYKNASSIASVINSASGSIMKIIGRGAAVNYGSSVFGTPSSLKEATWYDTRFSGHNGGYFAIGKNVQSNSMTVFRPFNIYSDADHKELILENARASGMTESDLKGVSLDNYGNVIKEIGFEGYADKMLGKYGIQTAEQLASSKKYIEESVVRLGLGSSLNEYMYNCHGFVREEQDGIDDINNGFNMGGYEDAIDFGDTGEEFEIDESLSDELDGVDVSDGVGEVDNLDDFIAGGTIIEEPNTYQEKANEFREAYKQAKDEKQEYINNGDLEPDVTARYGNIGVNIDTDGNVRVKDYSGYNVVELDKDEYIETDEPQHKGIQRFMGKLMESDYGINYQFKQRWNYILSSIDRAFPRRAMVMRVSVFNDIIIANTTIVNVMKMLDDGYGIMLGDIVNFRELITRFTNLKELTLDENSYGWLLKEFRGSQLGIEEVFVIGRNLEKVMVTKADGRTLVIDRMNAMGRRGETQKEYKKEEFRQQVEQMSAAYNPKVERKGVVYTKRVADTSFGFTKSSWGKVKNNLANKNDRHYIKGTVWVGAAAVSAVLGGVFWGSSKLIKRFGK